MLNDLLELESGLTMWEVEFIESLSKKCERPLSAKQRALLVRLWEDKV
jgi:hypothetical protein